MALTQMEAELSAKLAQAYRAAKTEVLDAIRRGADMRRVVYTTVQRVNLSEGRPPKPPWHVRVVMDKVADALDKEARS